MKERDLAVEGQSSLVGHALRSAVKRAEPGALQVMGFGGEPKVAIGKVNIRPKRVVSGNSVKISFRHKEWA